MQVGPYLPLDQEVWRMASEDSTLNHRQRVLTLLARRIHRECKTVRARETLRAVNALCGASATRSRETRDSPATCPIGSDPPASEERLKALEDIGAISMLIRLNHGSDVP